MIQPDVNHWAETDKFATNVFAAPKAQVVGVPRLKHMRARTRVCRDRRASVWFSSKLLTKNKVRLYQLDDPLLQISKKSHETHLGGREGWLG